MIRVESIRIEEFRGIRDLTLDLNGRSYAVCGARFSGADEPYKKLQRALNAEIDEDAWSTLYSTVSIPFDAPSTGKIAVKAINHYGDEALKVYEFGKHAEVLR